MTRRKPVAACVVVLALLALASAAAALDEAERLWLVGEQAVADQLYPVARRALDRFVTLYPDDPRVPHALLLLGKARLALDEPAEGLDAITRARARQLAPEQALEARFWEGEALFRLKRFSEARAAYDEVLRTNAASPLAPEALFAYGWTELELKRPEPAVTAFQDFLKTWPDHARADAAVLQLARALVELKRLPDALSVLEGFATRYPRSRRLGDAQYLLGWTKVTSGDARGGIQDLRAFVAAHPDHPQTPAARRLLTQTLARHGDREEQRESYKALLAQQPPTPEALHDAAMIATRLNQPGDREAAWKRLRAEFPEHPLTRRLALDFASSEFKQKDWKQTVALAQVAAQSQEPGIRAEALLLAGEAELKQRRFTAAEKAFDAVGDIAEADAGVKQRALAGLGLSREERKEWRGALAAYEAAAKSTADPTLREWARERAAAVQGRLKAATPPAKKPAPKQAEPAKGKNRS
jgi:TolA-binding protein